MIYLQVKKYFVLKLLTYFFLFEILAKFLSAHINDDVIRIKHINIQYKIFISKKKKKNFDIV